MPVPEPPPDGTDWLDELEPVVGPPYLRMGTHGSGPEWLTSRPHDAALLAEKRRVLAAHHDEAFAALPGTEDAGAAVLAAVRERVGVGPPGDAPPPSHPLDAAGRLVAEDLCLLVPGLSAGGWVLGAGSVCFPSHWRLRDKLGLPVAAIHGPVPHYADELAGRVDRFLDRLGPGRAAWRRNWTVHTSPTLFVPEAPPPPVPLVTLGDAGDRLWLRSERQALAGLAGAPAVAFTIRTDQVPLRELAARPDLCGRLADAAAAWSPGLLAYRGGEAVRRPLVAWLRGVAAAGRR